MRTYALFFLFALAFSLQGCNGTESGPVDGSIAGERSADGTVLQAGQKGIVSPTPPEDADGGKVDSLYTTLDPEKCETIELDEEGAGYSLQKCEGAFGYGLEVSEGDIRQTIIVTDPAGKRHDLDLVNVVSSGFSSVGKKAEWRFRTENGKKVPFALIVRYDVNEDPSGATKVTSYLTVSKITSDAVCVTDVVKPIKNANERARVLALDAHAKPCLKRR
jgi:hypothetical protein